MNQQRVFHFVQQPSPMKSFPISQHFASQSSIVHPQRQSQQQPQNIVYLSSLVHNINLKSTHSPNTLGTTTTTTTTPVANLTPIGQQIPGQQHSQILFNTNQRKQSGQNLPTQKQMPIATQITIQPHSRTHSLHQQQLPLTNQINNSQLQSTSKQYSLISPNQQRSSSIAQFVQPLKQQTQVKHQTQNQQQIIVNNPSPQKIQPILPVMLDYSEFDEKTLQSNNQQQKHALSLFPSMKPMNPLPHFAQVTLSQDQQLTNNPPSTLRSMRELVNGLQEIKNKNTPPNIDGRQNASKNDNTNNNLTYQNSNSAINIQDNSRSEFTYTYNPTSREDILNMSFSNQKRRQTTESEGERFRASTDGDQNSLIGQVDHQDLSSYLYSGALHSPPKSMNKQHEPLNYSNQVIAAAAAAVAVARASYSHTTESPTIKSAEPSNSQQPSKEEQAQQEQHQSFEQNKSQNPLNDLTLSPLLISNNNNNNNNMNNAITQNRRRLISGFTDSTVNNNNNNNNNENSFYMMPQINLQEDSNDSLSASNHNQQHYLLPPYNLESQFPQSQFAPKQLPSQLFKQLNELDAQAQPQQYQQYLKPSFVSQQSYQQPIYGSPCRTINGSVSIQYVSKANPMPHFNHSQSDFIGTPERSKDAISCVFINPSEKKVPSKIKIKYTPADKLNISKDNSQNHSTSPYVIPNQSQRKQNPSSLNFLAASIDFLQSTAKESPEKRVPIKDILNSMDVDSFKESRSYEQSSLHS